ncbi:rod shape-determining protein MreB [Caldanaerobius fijiensis DSM 17918]|uniref:Cell shape-determining protein MreB n=1 Tax=Caldanaerobius fijiensis DSM 17918 TaxID=1121256 RepID=A0A1M4US45_9THEO|nr:rod shape-determining protein MreB [Caldanaerobius fijiensis]SHE59509.1 rod shape-determining protein MreB [Caldanaerobius fijiensis DSM 17918]
MFGFGMDIGIDLGTASVLVYVKGKGIVLMEPSVVAVEAKTGKIVAIGSEARRMIGRTPGNIVAVRPLRQGVISNFDVTRKMLRHFINKACGERSFFRPRVMISVPSSITEVEKRAVIDAAYQAGAKKAFLIEEPIAAAIGAGLDISKPSGSMVVDIGGGTTDIAVISLGGAVVSTSIKVAGDDFDEVITRYIRKKYHLMIGERTAEELKINAGAAYPQNPPLKMSVRGRSLVTGLPMIVEINSDELLEALSEPLNVLIDAVHGVLEKTPPELVGDIGDKGIVMTGGGSLLRDLNKLLQDRLNVPVYLADDPVSCVARGTGKALDYIGILDTSSIYSDDKIVFSER